MTLGQLAIRHSSGHFAVRSQIMRARFIDESERARLSRTSLSLPSSPARQAQEREQTKWHAAR